MSDAVSAFNFRSLSKLQWFEPESSALEGLAYDRDNETLFVVMRSNNSRLYGYEGVTETVYDELLGSDSHGRYFSQNIRSQYPTTRVEVEEVLA